MADDWTLVEYRPGRYAKVTPGGDFLGMASTAEVQTWFAERRGRIVPRSMPEFLAKRRGAPVENATPVAEPRARPAQDDLEPEPPRGHDRSIETDLDVLPSARTDDESVEAAPPIPSGGVDDALTAVVPPSPLREERVELAKLDLGVSPADEPDSTGDEQTEADAETVNAAVDAQTGEPEPSAVESISPVSESQIIEAAASRENVAQWLWVDPRQESSYNPAGFDLAAFLERAVALFESKAWTGGQKPRRLAVHPNDITNSLEPVAEALGLEVLSDSQVSPGTFRLGLAEPETGK